MGAKRITQKTSRIDARQRETRIKFMKGILANDPEWAELVAKVLAKEGGGLVRQPGETLLEFWARANMMTPQEAEVQCGVIAAGGSFDEARDALVKLRGLPPVT